MKVNRWENFGVEENIFRYLDIPTRFKQTIFRLARYIPYVQREIAKAKDDTMKSIYTDMAKSIQGHQFARALPERGLSKVRQLNDFERTMRTNFFRKNFWKNSNNIEIWRRLVIQLEKSLVVSIRRQVPIQQRFTIR